MMNACPVYAPGTWRTPSTPMPKRGEPLAVLEAVVADRRHHDRLAADVLQVVRDVARAAAPLAAHLADLERHRQHVRLLGQDVPREVIGEHHDGVVGERAADERAHRCPEERENAEVYRFRHRRWRAAAAECRANRRAPPAIPSD